MKLIHNGKPTAKFRALESAHKARPNGIEVRRYARGFSDYAVLRELVLEGLLEVKSSGPKGGARYHITDSGAYEVYAYEMGIYPERK